MKIALLNLPLDSNFGGNLQRYALVRTLESMGHHVTFIQCRPRLTGSWTERFKKRVGLLFRDDDGAFVKAHVPHSARIFNRRELCLFYKKNGSGFDAFVVGSDQVWRKKFAHFYGLETYFFDFLEEAAPKARRIAYGVSLGSAEPELCNQEVASLTPLYNKFDAVSVRESSALDLLREYGWVSPRARQVLDPTFLLDSTNYAGLVNLSKTKSIRPQGSQTGTLLCYLLDDSAQKRDLVQKIAKERGLELFFVNQDGHDGAKDSIEQRLRYFMECDCVFTDSFHGLVFSIIFGRPYYLLKNEFRGNGRFDSLLDLLELPEIGLDVDFARVNERLQALRADSIKFLKEALSEAK